MPGEVTLAHQLGKDFMPVTGGSQVAYVLLEAKPTEMMAQVRMPLNFAIVLDHSGSMRGAKLKNVKEAVKMVINRMEPSDYISVVIFDDTAQVIIPSMQANDPIGMSAAIDRIPDAGGTTMSLGMMQGLNELRRWNIPNAVKRMILLTDGVTYGDTDRCRQLARDAAAGGISIPSACAALIVMPWAAATLRCPESRARLAPHPQPMSSTRLCSSMWARSCRKSSLRSCARSRSSPSSHTAQL